MDLKTMLKGMLETRDCLGLQEHKVLTLNTIYRFPIEEPKTQEMKVIKDFAMGCFREGWIHAVSIIQKSLEETIPSTPHKNNSHQMPGSSFMDGELGTRCKKPIGDTRKGSEESNE